MSGVDENIFNTDPTIYKNRSLFLNDKMGLIEEISQHYPDILALCDRLVAMNWHRDEFDYKPCNAEFKSAPKNIYDMMLLNIRYQWCLDSVVTRSISGTVHPFVTSSELHAAWTYVAYNEVLHSLSYSSILRNSFDDPSVVLEDTLSFKEIIDRLEPIAHQLSVTYDVGNRYALGLLGNNQNTYNAIFMYVVVLLLIERIQFMASFAVTFSIAELGMFLPIASAVKKIMDDELSIHVELDKTILKHEMQTERGKIAYTQNKHHIKYLIDSVVNAEFTWVDFLFSEGRELVGVTPELLKEWVLWCARDVYNFLNIETEHKLPTSNPLPFMDIWIRNDHQASPQEEKSVAYMLGMVKDDVGDEVFDVDL